MDDGVFRGSPKSSNSASSSSEMDTASKSSSYASSPPTDLVRVAISLSEESNAVTWWSPVFFASSTSFFFVSCLTHFVSASPKESTRKGTTWSSNSE